MHIDRWPDNMMKLCASFWIIPRGINQKKAYNIQNTRNKVARVTDIHSGISLHLIPLGNACSPAVWNMLMSRLLSAVAGTTMQSYEVHHSQ